MDISDYLKKNIANPYWQDILNTSYQQLGLRLELLKSELNKNKYETQKLLQDNLSLYLSAQDNAFKLKDEFKQLKNQQLNNFQSIKARLADIKAEYKSSSSSSSQVPSQLQSGAEKQIIQYNNSPSIIQNWEQKINEYSEIFDIQKCIGSTIKLQLYEEASDSINWLENFQKQLKNEKRFDVLQDHFSQMAKKFRKAFVEQALANFQRKTKDSLIDNLRKILKTMDESEKEGEKLDFLSLILSTYFNQMIRARIEKQALNPLAQQYLTQCISTYSRTVNKSIAFALEVAEGSSREFKSKIKFQSFYANVRKSLADIFEGVQMNDPRYIEYLVQRESFVYPFEHIFSVKMNSTDQYQSYFIRKFFALLRYSLYNKNFHEFFQYVQESFSVDVSREEGAKKELNKVAFIEQLKYSDLLASIYNTIHFHSLVSKSKNTSTKKSQNFIRKIFCELSNYLVQYFPSEVQKLSAQIAYITDSLIELPNS